MFVKGTSDEEEALREEEERQRKLKDIVGKADLSLVKNLTNILSKVKSIYSNSAIETLGKGVKYVQGR